MKSYNFLFWAYNVIWLGLAGYLGFLFTRLRRLDRRLDRLEHRGGASGGGAGAGS